MKTLITLLSLIITTSTFAHPVIYKGGWAVSSANMADYSNNYVMYSLSHRFAIGADHWRFSDRTGNDNEMGLAKFNYLLWRANGENSQANIYLHGGVGVEDQNIEKKQTRGTFMGGAEIDWETRTLFTALKHYQFQNLSVSQARVGFSPKETPFDELQTWFMVQAMTITNLNDQVMITPMLRFFYHNVLWEMGSSTKGDWMLNLMVHY